MSDETVTIPKAEYDSLRRDACLLQALEHGGVDNWDWYGDALTEYRKLLEAEGIPND